MTEKHISLTFNSDKYPDGTIRNQFKIDIQSKPSPRKKEDDIIEYLTKFEEVMNREIDKLFPETGK